MEPNRDEEKPQAMDITSLDTYVLLTLFVNILTTQAWQHMGLRVKPGEDNTKLDLELARTVIDCIAFLVDKLTAHVQESEVKRLKNLLADLQINFVRISKS